MNTRLERYLSGAAFYQRTVYRGGGRKFRVFDRNVRVRAAARTIVSSGKTHMQAARMLHRPTDFIRAMCRATSAADALFLATARTKKETPACAEFVEPTR